MSAFETSRQALDSNSGLLSLLDKSIAVYFQSKRCELWESRPRVQLSGL